MTRQDGSEAVSFQRARSDLGREIAALRTHPRFALAIRLGSWVLVAASALFLVTVAARHWDELTRVALTGPQWAVLAVLAVLVVVYGAALFLLGLAWHGVLLALDARPHSLVHSVRSHTTAQLAKYVPGNVFHFVGRHLMHSARGGDDKRLALAAVVENGLLVLAAVAVSLACLAFGADAGIRPLTLALGLTFAAGLAVAVLFAARLNGPQRGSAIAAFAAMLGFFTVMAGVLVALGQMVGLGTSPALAGGGIAAWIAGFLTPGAPGGLGIREAVMVIAGGGGASADKLLMLGVLLRVVTFGGDVLCALAGRALPVAPDLES